MLGCYRKKMNGKEKIFYDILFKNCTEKEIYEILLKKKETSGSRPLWARSKFGLWYAALGVVKMLHTDNKQQIRK